MLLVQGNDCKNVLPDKETCQNKPDLCQIGIAIHQRDLPEIPVCNQWMLVTISSSITKYLRNIYVMFNFSQYNPITSDNYCAVAKLICSDYRNLPV